MRQGTATELGPALRKIRTTRGLSLDEVARDTRIRREFLEALEAQDFDRLLGDVHVRGCLRTYASYLHLSPDKVISAYASLHPGSISTPVGALPAERSLDRPRRRDDHRLLVMIAATVLVLAAAFGILSARNSTPPPADLGATGAGDTGAAIDPARSIGVGVVARDPVVVTVVIDDAPPRRYHLEAGEGRGFEAQQSLTIRLSDGGAAEVSVSGSEPAVPGIAGEPWEETYSYRTGSTGSP